MMLFSKKEKPVIPPYIIKVGDEIKKGNVDFVTNEEVWQEYLLKHPNADRLGYLNVYGSRRSEYRIKKDDPKVIIFGNRYHEMTISINGNEMTVTDVDQEDYLFNCIKYHESRPESRVYQIKQAPIDELSNQVKKIEEWQ